SYPVEFTEAGGVVYFGAASGDGIHDRGVSNGIAQRELWRSDGTEAGTFLAADINPGLDASFPSDLTALGRVLFFIAADGQHGRELWKFEETPSPGIIRFDTTTARVSESDGSVMLTVLRTNGRAGAVSVHYGTGGTATPGVDYTVGAGTLD